MPLKTNAGQQFTITMKALNAANKPDTLFVDTVHFTSSDTQAVLPADYTFTASDNGSHLFSVTFVTAGKQSLTATDTRPVPSPAVSRTGSSRSLRGDI